jgi:hypothetical protein
MVKSPANKSVIPTDAPGDIRATRNIHTSGKSKRIRTTVRAR